MSLWWALERRTGMNSHRWITLPRHQSLEGTRGGETGSRGQEWGPEPRQQKLGWGGGGERLCEVNPQSNFLFSVIFFSPKVSVWVFPFIWKFWDNWKFICSCKKQYREISCTLYPVFPKGDILQNYSIKAQPGYRHCYNPPILDYLSFTCTRVCVRVYMNYWFFFYTFMSLLKFSICLKRVHP